MSSRITRRSILKRITMASVFSMINGWLSPFAQAIQQVTIPLKGIPVLTEIQGGLILKIKTLKKDVLLIRTGKESVSALSPICTHKKCTVKYKKEWGEIQCKCHGSKYSLDGKVTKGPAKKDLTAYKATIKGNNLILSIEP